ncbi:hypothetical protein HQ496_03915 [bacterium]|nr:hypothetical protein [bacterium]
MFWNKKNDSNPLGVPLGEVLLMLQATSIKASLKGNILTAQHEHYRIKIEVISPQSPESENGPMRAVVRLITELPRAVLSLFQGKEAEVTSDINAFAALGSLYTDRGNIFIGSRLTIYEAENSWRTLHLPLLVYTAIAGTEAILGGIRRSIQKEELPPVSDSKWVERDFKNVEDLLSRISVCSSGDMGFTAEFGLSEGAVSAVFGDQMTALFQLMADQPHPELGAGLFCILQMPHQLTDKNHLYQVCLKLNNMEMAIHDLPPHFGAWCPGRLGNNPAYISFLPNQLYRVSGIAVNVSVWAEARAQWANSALAALGVHI